MNNQSKKTTAAPAAANSQALTGEGNAPRIDGNHEDYIFSEGPIPIGAKSFGFDERGQINAKLACIAYSGTVPCPTRGIDIHGNYWCSTPEDKVSIQLSGGEIRFLQHCIERFDADDECYRAWAVLYLKFLRSKLNFI